MNIDDGEVLVIFYMYKEYSNGSIRYFGRIMKSFTEAEAFLKASVEVENGLELVPIRNYWVEPGEIIFQKEDKLYLIEVESRFVQSNIAPGLVIKMGLLKNYIVKDKAYVDPISMCTYWEIERNDH
jgi:hypothetical protein